MKDFSKSCVKSTLSVATALSVFFAGSYPKDNQMLVSAACIYPSENQTDSSECYAGIIKAIQQMKAEEPESKVETDVETEIEKTKEITNNTKEENKKKKESKSKSKNQKKSIEETIIEKEIEPITMYTTTTVNFRENPSLDANIIKTISRNTQVTKIANCGDWSKVKLTNNEEYGYIHTNYLSDTKQPNRWNITLTADEITLLEKIVWREAGNQSLVGQEAVAEVVLNRMASKDFPNTLYEVLSQKGQFVSWAVRNVGTPTESVKKAVKEVLDGNTYILSSNYLYFSRGGHTNHSGMVKIGDHQFCPRT